MSDTRRDGWYTYLAVIPFMAANDQDARHFLFTTAEGLGVLRPEVDFYRTQIQGPGDNKPHDVFCCAPGPRLGQACVDIAGHHTPHRDATGTQWADNDGPTVPDTPAGLDT